MTLKVICLFGLHYSCPAYQETQHCPEAGAGRGSLREGLPRRVLQPDTGPGEAPRGGQGTDREAAC